MILGDFILQSLAALERESRYNMAAAVVLGAGSCGLCRLARSCVLVLYKMSAACTVSLFRQHKLIVFPWLQNKPDTQPNA